MTFHVDKRMNLSRRTNSLTLELCNNNNNNTWTTNRTKEGLEKYTIIVEYVHALWSLVDITNRQSISNRRRGLEKYWQIIVEQYFPSMDNWHEQIAVTLSTCREHMLSKCTRTFIKMAHVPDQKHLSKIKKFKCRRVCSLSFA